MPIGRCPSNIGCQPPLTMTEVVSWKRPLRSLLKVTFWLGLFLFERSWANFIGFSLTVYAYVGAAALLLDRFLLIKFEAGPSPIESDAEAIESAAR